MSFKQTLNTFSQLSRFEPCGKLSNVVLGTKCARNIRYSLKIVFRMFFFFGFEQHKFV